MEMECGYFSWCLFADCKASLGASAASGALLSPEQGANNSLSVCFGLGRCSCSWRRQGRLLARPRCVSAAADCRAGGGGPVAEQLRQFIGTT